MYVDPEWIENATDDEDDVNGDGIWTENARETCANTMKIVFNQIFINANTRERFCRKKKHFQGRAFRFGHQNSKSCCESFNAFPSSPNPVHRPNTISTEINKLNSMQLFVKTQSVRSNDERPNEFFFCCFRRWSNDKVCITIWWISQTTFSVILNPLDLLSSLFNVRLLFFSLCSFSVLFHL